MALILTKLSHHDVKMVFLNGNLKEEVYIWHPQGFLEPWKENMVCKLNKLFYGLK
jgi:hypothetical protein